MDSIKCPDRQVRVASLQRSRDIVDADSATRQRRWIELHAHGVLLLAGDQNLRDTADRRESLRQRCVGVLIHLRQRQRRRTNHQIDDRLIGGIYFFQRRLVRHAGRQLP